MSNGVRITVRLPEELKAATDAKCKREDITLSQVVRRCLREWVKDDPREGDDKRD